MSNLKKSLSKIFVATNTNTMVKNLIYNSDFLHNMASKVHFSLNNTLNYNIHRIPYFILRKIDNTSVIIDCGANIGAISKPLLQYNPKQIICFEPNPVAFSKLKENIGDNKNVTLYNQAVGIQKEVLKLYKHQAAGQNELHHSVSSSLLATKANVNTDDYYEVDVINFIEFLEKIEGEVYILKVDIEGAEVSLLNGIIDSGVHSKVKYIFVETHENTLPELKESTLALIQKAKSKRIKNIYFNWA